MRHIKPFQIFEMHYADMYGASFEDFVTKYKKIARGSKGVYYVQFTNHKDNNIDKSAHNTPDHSDPVGNYAYPIEYVLNYPADIMYGQSAKHLRVLRVKTDKVLHLNDIRTENDYMEEASRLNPAWRLSTVREFTKLAEKNYKDRVKAPNKWAKMFVQVLQVDFQSKPTVSEAGFFSKEREVYRVRTGREQTDMLIAAGYHAMLDSSKNNKSAAINDREPEQIVFLTPTSFKVEEVYTLRGESRHDATQRSIVVNRIKPSGVRRIANQLLNAMGGDRIKESHPSVDGLYFSVAGRSIQMTTELHPSYYEDKDMGEKIHKQYKHHSAEILRAVAETEYGTIKAKMNQDETVGDLVEMVEYKWGKISSGEPSPDWEPRNVKAYDDQIAQAEQERIDKIRREEKDKILSKVPKLRARLAHFADTYGMTEPENVTDSDYVKLYSLVDGMFNLLYYSRFKEKLEVIAYLDLTSEYELFDKGEDTMTILRLWKYGSDKFFDVYSKLLIRFVEENLPDVISHDSCFNLRIKFWG
jgi:hypothetical protein